MQSISSYIPNLNFFNKTSWFEWVPNSEKILDHGDLSKTSDLVTFKNITIIASLAIIFFLSVSIYYKCIKTETSELLIGAKESDRNSIKAENKQNIDCSYQGQLTLHDTRTGQLLIGGKLLENGVNTEKKDSLNKISLHVACRIGSEKIVKSLRKSGANINAKDKDGYTPIYVSIINHQEHLIDELLKFPKIKQESLDTCLRNIICFYHGKAKVELIKKLIEKGANPNIKIVKQDIYGNDNTEPILHSILKQISESFDNYRIFDLLIQHGVDLNATNINEETALHVAIKTKQTSIVEILLKKGVNIEKKDSLKRTPLYLACLIGSNVNEELAPYNVEPILHSVLNRTSKSFDSSQVIDLLIKYGADLNTTDQDRKTLLHAAIFGRQPLAVIAKFLENDANTEKKDYLNWTPLMLACIMGSTEIVQLLRKYDADINTSDDNGRSPIAVTMVLNHYHLIDDLLEFPGIKQEDLDFGLYALIFPSTLVIVEKSINKADYVKKFLAKGANPNISGLHNTAPILHSVFKHTSKYLDSWQIMDLLIQYGANLNAKDIDGNTLLHRFAMWHADSELIDYLIEKGADPKIPDRFGNVPAIKKRSTLSIAATDKKV